MASCRYFFVRGCFVEMAHIIVYLCEMVFQTFNTDVLSVFFAFHHALKTFFPGNSDLVVVPQVEMREAV